MAEVNGYTDKLAGQAALMAEKSFYHPRLMLYAVGWLKANPPQAVIKALETLKGKEVEKALEEMVGRTLRQMTEQEGDALLKALKRLNVTLGGFDRAAAEALLADSLEDDPMLSDLTTLAAWNLLDYDNGRYTIDPLVVRAAGVDADAFIAHYDYYKSLAERHHKAQDYQGLDPESANLEGAFERAMQRDPVAALWLTNVCYFFLKNRMRLRQSMEWFKRVESALIGNTDSAVQGALQNSLGNVYWAMAEVEDSAANLSRAIAAYTEALRFYPVASDRLNYAMMQNNLGIAYSGLARVEDKAANLHRAIDAFFEALHFYTSADAPPDYAMTQNNLGIAYSGLAGVEDKAANLRRAIDAFFEALRFYTPADARLNYAMTQYNLGNAYSEMAGVEDKSANLHRAIDAYGQALRFYTPATDPLNYAKTQVNLGADYDDLAEVEDRAANLRRAIAAYTEALRLSNPDVALLDYAGTQNNLGNTYRDLAEVEDKAGNLHQAITAYNEALRFYNPNVIPLDYARTQFKLGLALADMGEYEKAYAAWREAERYYRAGDMIDAADQIAALLKKAGC